MNPNALEYQKLLEQVKNIFSEINANQNQLYELETTLDKCLKVDNNITFKNQINSIRNSNKNIIEEINNIIIPTIKQNIM